MPAVGSERDRMRTFGDFPMVPEKYQAAMRFGIRFFELRLRGRKDNDQTLFGPFDVRVREFFDTTRQRERFVDTWLTGTNAHIRYEVDRRGTGVAFMPDDKYWHNRIILMNSRGLLVMQYHTKDGILPGSITNAEVACMRQRLKAEVPIYTVLEDRKPRDWFFEEKEASQFIKEQQDLVQIVDKQTGQIRKGKAQRSSYRIVPGKKLVWKPEILDLIKAESGHEFGWTQSLYFQEKIKPEIEAMIEQQNKNEMPVAADDSRRGNIMREILGLSAEEKQRLKQELGLDSMAAPEGEDELPPPPVPGGVDKAFVWEKRTKGALNRMTMPQLQTILQGRGLPIDGISKPLLVHKILETDAQQENAETQPQEIVT